MTIESWKKEFYPVEAKDCPRCPAAELDHSILKWEGLKNESLEKHGLYLQWRHLYDKHTEDEVFFLSGVSCALCHRYLTSDCQECPITKARGKACQGTMAGDPAPWGALLQREDPEPMLMWLRKAKEML